MPNPTPASGLSIPLADFAATGHVNAGIDLVKKFEAVATAKRPKGEGLDTAFVYNDPATWKGFEFRLSINTDESQKRDEWGPLEISTFDQAASYASEMYIHWRYLYERFTTELDVSVGFAPLYFSALAVDHAIKNHQGPTRITIK